MRFRIQASFIFFFFFSLFTLFIIPSFLPPPSFLHFCGKMNMYGIFHSFSLFLLLLVVIIPKIKSEPPITPTVTYNGEYPPPGRYDACTFEGPNNTFYLFGGMIHYYSFYFILLLHLLFTFIFLSLRLTHHILVVEYHYYIIIYY